MNTLGRSHRFARLLAAWLLLWFVVMSLPQTLAQPAQAPSASASECDDHEGHHGHEIVRDHAQHEDVHAAHGSGATKHCPLCLHAAAPPPPLIAAASPEIAPADRASTPRRIHLPVRTDAPPPARGPPLLS
jgi:hypothetical protein